MVKRPLRLLAVSSIVLLFATIVAACQSAPPPAPTQAPAKQPASAPAAQPAAAQPTAAPAAKPAASTPDFPTRPIEYVVPFAAGGGSGITAETINKVITDYKLSPQPITISYKPGASGTIGQAYVAGRKGDGHVFGAATSSFVSASVVKDTPLHPTKDFTPIAVMAVDELLMVTHPNSPIKSVQDIVDASKKSPKSVKVAVTSATGSEATAVALMEMATDIKLNTIPFNSGAEVNAAILGGQVELAISNPNELFPNIEAGKLRPVVVYSEKRMSALKDTPTMVELGYKDALMHNPRGIIAPAGIPKNQEDWLINLMKQVTESKEWKAYVDKNMMTLTFLGGADYAKYLEGEWKMYTDVYTKMGILKK